MILHNTLNISEFEYDWFDELHCTDKQFFHIFPVWPCKLFHACLVETWQKIAFEKKAQWAPLPFSGQSKNQ